MKQPTPLEPVTKTARCQKCGELWQLEADSEPVASLTGCLLCCPPSPRENFTFTKRFDTPNEAMQKL